MQNKIDNYALFRRGADDGFLLGLYFSALFFAMVYSMAVPLLSMAALALMAGVPVVIYKFLRRSYVAEYGTTRFSALWMQGIVTFFCGSLILALVSFVFMRWIEPDYIESVMRQVVEVYGGASWPQGARRPTCFSMRWMPDWCRERSRCRWSFCGQECSPVRSCR